MPKRHRGWRWSEQLQLYLGIQDKKLRFFTPEAELVPAPAEAAIAERQRAEAAYAQLQRAEARARAEQQRAEQAEARAEQERQRAEQERQRAEQERQRAEQERQRAEQLLAQLHALGIPPNLNGGLDKRTEEE